MKSSQKSENQIIDLMKKNMCNEIHVQIDESGCIFIIAMNTRYGNKGNGGTRMMKYPTFLDGIEDATKLIDVMTKKCVVIGKKYNGGFSGGKGVIVGDPKTKKTPALLRRYGKFVQVLNGRIQTGTDMNIDLKDIEFMAEESKFIDGLASGLGDTAIPTAYGIYVAMKKVCKLLYKENNLVDKTIAVQGVGSVGENLIKYLVDEGAKVIATDADFKKLSKIKSKYKIDIVRPDDIYKVKCDIFSPNAIGGILTDDVIANLNCKMIIGAANNPLPNGINTVKKLEKRKIIYVPDYVINIGGVFLSMCEVQGKNFDFVMEKTKDIIEKRLEQIFLLRKKRKTSVYEVAEKIIVREMSKV